MGSLDHSADSSSHETGGDEKKFADVASGEIDSPTHCENADEESETKSNDDAGDMISIRAKELLHFNDPESCERVEIDTAESQDEENRNDDSLKHKLP